MKSNPVSSLYFDECGFGRPAQAIGVRFAAAATAFDEIRQLYE